MPYNDAMSYLEIILPFAIPPQALAQALMKQLQAPALATLLGHAKTAISHEFDEHARQLPHEHWLTRSFSENQTRTASIDTRGNSPALSHFYMQQHGVCPEQGYWFTLSPVHIHVARDHLVMTDPRRLPMSEEESRALFAAAQPLCQELGHELVYGEGRTWFLRADQWRTLATASLSAASGHNMDIWIAQGENAVAWRKLQNEIQMLWHMHPVNQNREALGINTINSLWLHSGSAALQKPTYEFGMTAFNAALSSGKEFQGKGVVLDDLAESSLNSDWGSWLTGMQDLEKSCFSPILQALRDQKMRAVNLVFSNTQRLCVIECRSPQRWKMWRKPSLQMLVELAETKN